MVGRLTQAGSSHSSSSVPSVDASVRHLSGGWRMKVELAKALWLKPKLLLLDEPTNHLDFNALARLEEQVEDYPHTTIVVSHDVTFLHSVCHEIFWFKDRHIQALPRDILSQDDLASMQRTRPLSFRFAVATEGAPHEHGVSVHQAEFCYPGRSSGVGTAAPQLQVRGHVRFSGCSRAVMLGKNGSGKSTFLALCAGKLHPSRGSVDMTPGCRVGYFSQQMDEIDCCAELTAVQYLVQECKEALESRLEIKIQAAARAAARRGDKVAASAAHQKQLAEAARGVLSGFGFDGDLAVAVPVGRLSGGQKSRLKLAVLSLHPAHILFLDEPTNHLDAEACEALAEGLSAFKGGLVVVTHDDLLIYRLIQCNWEKSELLICQGGAVHCRKDFGGHCLKTLKKQARQSESAAETEVSEPSSPERCRTPPPAKPPGTGPSAVPPWLQRSAPRGGARRSQAPKQDLSKDDLQDNPMQLPSTTRMAKSSEGALAIVPSPSRIRSRRPVCWVVGTPPQDNSARIDATMANHPTGLSRLDLPIWETDACSTITRLQVSAPPVLNPAPSLDVPDRWDEDDEDEAAFDGSRNVCMMPEVPALCTFAQPLQDGSDTESPEDFLQHFDQATKTGPDPAGSGHSRFRKDLVNLNKSVAKWLAQEASGYLTRDELSHRICDSSAAKCLRARHGARFREADFVRDAIARHEKNVG